MNDHKIVVRGLTIMQTEEVLEVRTTNEQKTCWWLVWSFIHMDCWRFFECYIWYCVLSNIISFNLDKRSASVSWWCLLACEVKNISFWDYWIKYFHLLLQKVCQQLGVPDDLVFYFALYLIRRESNRGMTIVRKLQDFESPYTSQKSDKTSKLVMRKWWVVCFVSTMNKMEVRLIINMDVIVIFTYMHYIILS